MNEHNRSDRAVRMQCPSCALKVTGVAEDFIGETTCPECGETGVFITASKSTLALNDHTTLLRRADLAPEEIEVTRQIRLNDKHGQLTLTHTPSGISVSQAFTLENETVTQSRLLKRLRLDVAEHNGAAKE